MISVIKPFIGVNPCSFLFYSVSESLLDLTCNFQFGFYVYCLSFLMLFWFQHDFENELSFFSEALFYYIAMNTLVFIGMELRCCRYTQVYGQNKLFSPLCVYIGSDTKSVRSLSISRFYLLDFKHEVRMSSEFIRFWHHLLGICSDSVS